MLTLASVSRAPLTWHGMHATAGLPASWLAIRGVVVGWSGPGGGTDAGVMRGAGSWACDWAE